MRTGVNKKAGWTPAGAATKWEGVPVDKEVASWAWTHAWHQEAERSTQGKTSRNASRAGLGGPSWFLFYHGLDILPAPMTSWAPRSLGHEARPGGTVLAWPCLPGALGQALRPCPVLVPSHLRVPRPGLPVGPVPWPSTMETTAPPDGVLLGSCGCPWFQPACHGPAPAAGRHTHAALAPLLTVHLVLCPIEPMAGPAGLG